MFALKPHCRSLLHIAEDDKCALCFKSAEETDEKALRAKHGCNICTARAWRVCEECHLSLLSRDCPVCRSPYQGLELFPFPFSAHPPPSIEWCAFLVVMRHSNVCLWEPAIRRASFMLAPACQGAEGIEGCHVAIAGVCIIFELPCLQLRLLHALSCIYTRGERFESVRGECAILKL